MSRITDQINKFVSNKSVGKTLPVSPPMDRCCDWDKQSGRKWIGSKYVSLERTIYIFS